MKVKLSWLRHSIIMLALLLLAGGIGYRLGKVNYFTLQKDRDFKLQEFTQIMTDKEVPADKQNLDFDLFWQTWDTLEHKYYNAAALNPQDMVYGAIAGMVASLKDPWTVFLPPTDNQRAKEDLNGEFEGVGIQLGYKDAQLAVVAPLKGLPAEAAGVKAGDLIVHIKDETKGLDVDASKISIYEAVEYIRGQKGTEVELTMFRTNNQEEKVFKIKRDTILVPSVELAVGKVIDNQWVEEKELSESDDYNLVVVLKVNRFGDNTLSEWITAVDKFSGRYQSGEIKAMVLDLRNNPGGYLTGSVSLASEFISKGVVVEQENSDGTVETYAVNRGGKLYDIPLIIVVNQGSASASEILAGSLRAHKRAKIVGEKTFGKGTIQEALEFGNAGLHVTTAKWLLPDGSWVNDTEGLIPDIEVANPENDDTTDLQLIKAVQEVVK